MRRYLATPRPLNISQSPHSAFLGAVLTVVMLGGLVAAGETPADSSPAGSRSASLAFSGDILPHLRVIRLARYYALAAHHPGSVASILRPPEMYGTWKESIDREYDFGPMFEPVASKLRAADLAICHLETTISSDNPKGYPRFRTPAELVEAIAGSGWDGCSLASNHSLDYGVDGVSRTIEAMEGQGLGFTGTATDQQSRGAAHYHVNGIHLAHLSYTYGLNGFKLPRNQDWWVNLINTDMITEDAATARAEGAEFIIASLHWGTEYRRLPDGYQQRIARAIAETGMVDLLIGHHAHVIQPIDRIGALWVVYGLGNFLSAQIRPSTRDGAILHVEIGDTADGLMVTSMAYTPTWVDRDTMQVVAVANRLLNPNLDHRERTILRRSWSRTVKAFGSLGAHHQGIRPTGYLP